MTRSEQTSKEQPALLQAFDLSYGVNGKTILDNISVALAQNELVGLIGPNGAGKSTLMKLLVGYLKTDTGDLLLNNESLHQLTPTERALSISYLAQHTQIDFQFSVIETLLMGCHAQETNGQLSSAQRHERLNQVTDTLKLNPLLTRTVNSLSGGEQQLVQFGRILMQAAPLMILDEPTASLDIGHETQLMSHIQQRCRAGSGALVSMHNLNTAAAFCDRLILLKDGNIVVQGTPTEVITKQHLEQVYHQPVDVYVHPLTGKLRILPLVPSV